MSLKAAFNRIFKSKPSVGRYDLHGITVNVAPDEKANVEALFDALASVPSGRQALDDMAQYKTAFFLESGLKTANAFFNPESNAIVMDRSLDPAAMQFILVHEARHLRQWHQGRKEAEALNPDFASKMMLVKATEADAQVQAFQACLEWRERGNAAPMEQFEKRDRSIVDGFNRSRSLSGAFKGWYDNDLTVAVYEFNHGIFPALMYLDENPEEKRPFTSLKPADIARFCGGNRIEGFERFLDSPKARRMHLMTKTAAEIYDSVSTAKGAAHDPSLKGVPLVPLNESPCTRMAADLLVARTHNTFPPSLTKNPVKRNILKTLNAVAVCVEKMNRAEIKGVTDIEASAGLEESKKRVLNAVNKNPLQALLPAYCSSRN